MFYSPVNPGRFTQTFSGNKTCSGTLTASGASATLGTATGTATYGIGTGVTTNGTGGASASNTVVNINFATAGAGGTTVINTPTVTFANAVTQVTMTSPCRTTIPWPLRRRPAGGAV